MSDVNQDQNRPDPFRGPWTDRVHFGDRLGASRYAYRPGQIIAAATEATRGLVGELAAGATVSDLGSSIHVIGVDDPLGLVDDLQMRGHRAHPNHVFFAHGADDCGCGPPHPASGQGANPVYASPVYASPVYASPVYASPVYASPVGHSSAVPAPAGVSVSGLVHELHEVQAGSPTVIVLDTGLAAPAFRPTAFEAPTPIHAASAADEDQPDENDDHQLDPAAGHGTFVAGVVDQVSPGCAIAVHRVLSTFGDGDEVAIAGCLNGLDLDDPTHTLINLSFGGYVLEHPHLLARAVRGLQRQGAVVVASAGNDATCRPTYPAALPDVVSVGAVGPGGPAPFTNYGSWVRACAPGVDLLSTFFRDFGSAGGGAGDPGRFDGWALWSGTSFAAPVVVGALARTMRTSRCTAVEAVERVIDAPAVMRIPYLGTVVNVM